MADYPILFGFRDAVAGRGFLAGVQVDGRALLTQEDGAWWAYGVDPGPVAASGATPIEAYQALRQAVQQVWFHSAELAESYEAFRADVERIFAQRDVEDEARWEVARLAIREGALQPVAPLDELPRRTTFRLGLVVDRLDGLESQRFRPEDNRVDEFELVTAA